MRALPRLLALAAVLALSAPALPAAAQVSPGSPAPAAAPTKAQQQEAAARFKKGIDAFKDEDYRVALVEFRRAEELAPNYTVLYNIAQVYFQLQDYPSALEALERYLKEGGDKIGAARRGDVQRDIEKLQARVANLEIATTVPDAEITIDDVSVGRSPLPRPVMVSAGRHKVTVSRAGFTAATKVVEIASGDLLQVSLDPIEQGHPVERPEAAPPPPAVDAPRPAEPAGALAQGAEKAPLPPSPPVSRPVPVAGIVVTSGLALGAVATGVLALGASSTLKTDRASSTASHDQLTGDATKTTALAAASDVLTGAAVVAFAVTLVVGLTGKRQAPPASGLTELHLGVGKSSLRLLGSF